VVKNIYFELFFAVAIFTNSILIGVQLEVALSNSKDDGEVAFVVLQHSYAALFLVELVMRVVSDGSSFFCSQQWKWNYIDVALLMFSLFEVIVDILSFESGSSVMGNQNLSSVRMLRIARITRLVRVLRIIRIVRFVRPLRTLVYSIGCTLKSLVSALLLLSMIIYLFGILFAQAVNDFLDGKDIDEQHIIGGIPGGMGSDLEDIGALRKYWGSLPRSMSTLFKSITGGVDWDVVVVSLDAVHWAWVILFHMFLAFALFAVLNVMTGVFCQSAIESARRDQDSLLPDLILQQQNYVERVTQLFHDIDSDSSGYITIGELEGSFKDDTLRARFASLGMDYTDAWTLFKLDVCGKEVIDGEQFLAGCLKMNGVAKSIDIANLTSEHKWMMEDLSEGQNRLGLQLEEWMKAHSARCDKQDLAVASRDASENCRLFES